MMQKDNRKKALEQLRNPHLGGALDLTGSNVQKLNKKAKRVLKSELEKYLPRRQRGTEYSSYYREIRLKLLPVNPHFNMDVAGLRELFHIPAGQIEDLDLTQFPDRPSPRNNDDKLPGSTAAALWLRLHRYLTKGLLPDPDFPPLPKWFAKSASLNPFTKKVEHNWLKIDVDIPEPFTRLLDIELPLDRCVAQLIVRYQLPWRLAGSLRFFILTLNEKYIENAIPFDFEINMVERPIGTAFAITIDWIDEYTTEKQWLKIWKDIIVPRQKRFLEERGELSHSKQIEIDRILQRIQREPWILEIYDMWGKGIGIDAALKRLTSEGKLPRGEEDPSTTYRLMKKLDQLTKPLY
jgi:hypothetical protein